MLITMRVITCLCICRQELTKVRSNRFQTLFHLCNNSADIVPFRLLALPDEYIKIIPHPHSLDTTPIIIPITLSATDHSSYRSSKTSTPLSVPSYPAVPPWAPFNTLADFEYTETAVQGLLSKELVNKQLAGIQGSWAVESRVTLRSYNDMEAALTQARRHYVQVSIDSNDPNSRTC